MSLIYVAPLQNYHVMDFTESNTPTVELNALAMKRKELATYRTIEMPRAPQLIPHGIDLRPLPAPQR